MRFVGQRPYLQLFVALALGTAAGFRWPLPGELLAHSGAWVWLLLAALGALAWLWRGHGKPVTMLLLFAVVTAVGALNISLAVHSALSMPLRAVAVETDYLRGTVASLPKYQRGHWRFLLDVDRARVGNEWTDAPGRVFAYLKAPAEAKLYFRERVSLRCSLEEVAPPPNRGQFNYRRYLLQRGTVLTAYAPTERCLRHLGESPPQPWAALTGLRERLLAAVTRGLPPQLGQLAASVIYGDKIIDLPEALEESFRRAGLTHILVASGTQVSLLIAVLALMLWRVGDNATWRGRLINAGKFLLTLGVVLAYGAVTGFETSIVRALVMGVVVLVGQAVSRKADGMTALAQAGLILLLLNPLELLAPGFQLSFGATFGLIYGAGVLFPLTQPLTGWRRALAQMLITTAGAQLFVAPILAAQFNQLSLWGLLSNLLAIPLATALLIIGGIASLGLIHLPLVGWLLQWVVFGLSWLLDAVAALFAALPGSSIAVPTPPLWWLLACYALIFLAGEWVKARRLVGATNASPAEDRPGLDSGDARVAPASIPNFAAAALTLILLIPLLHWLLVPRPELTALSLTRAEAYLWRDPGGRSLLLLRRAWLTRSHNLDTLTSALRCRGINRLHGVYWLDGASEPCPLADYPAPLLDTAELAQFGLAVDPATGAICATTRSCRIELARVSGGGLISAAWSGQNQGDAQSAETELSILVGGGKPRARVFVPPGP